MNILIVTDAWLPQVNGVVRTIETIAEELQRLGQRVAVIGPDQFRTVPLPTYGEIRVAINAHGKLARLVDQMRPDAIHIATEGPLGLAARRYCLRRGIPFTTAYHTRFPEYVADRAPVPKAICYRLLRWFHAPAAAVMVATPSIEAELSRRGLRNIRRWTRGVDTRLFRSGRHDFLDAPCPISMYVGRVSVEKNVQAFLDLDLPGTKYVVGGGPQLEWFRRLYPDVRFVGPRFGEDLAAHHAAADVFVFPSRTDTFGLVLLEALACGVPVAAYPVAGPLDVVGGNPRVAALDDDLGAAVRRLLADPPSPEACRAHALRFTWRASAEQFLNNLEPFEAQAVDLMVEA